MSKREMIDRIVARNPSARPGFLAEFSEEDLGAYLHQLEAVAQESYAACPTPPPDIHVGVGCGAHANACLGG